MKKKIALLVVMVLSMFCLVNGLATKVSADGNGVTPVDSPDPQP
ncbi:MAG: hypothetical protein KQ78_00395 [Candidatus Izimaplasma bacterium HR2]|nr:MAG: hypothetical protein KQ78_00395 [Candidatus Izimaplasma bacterium HR2]